MGLQVMDMKREDRTILAIDLKSFYASVECLRRGMDPFSTPLVVADLSRGDNTIVLAASPFIRERHKVKSRCRLREVDKTISGLVIARPHMADYLSKSAEVVSIFLDYVDEKDLHVYSIDESFLDVTHYLSRGKDTPESYAMKILSDIRTKTGLTAACGIGRNLFMAKACLDIDAKKAKDFLARWDYPDVPMKLWPVEPLSRMWGIGGRLERKLNARGFYRVGDIAVSDPAYLRRTFGEIGEEIYWHAQGYDDARIQEKYRPKDTSLSVGEVLLRDYEAKEIPTLLNDLSFELADRLLSEGKKAGGITLHLGRRDGTGYGLKLAFLEPTDSPLEIARRLIGAYQARGEEKTPCRQIHLVASPLFDFCCYQGTLFEDVERRRREGDLERLLMRIRKGYGTTKAMPCSALSLASTFIQRDGQIGGHHR